MTHSWIRRALLSAFALLFVSCSSAPPPVKTGPTRPWQKPSFGGYQQTFVDALGHRFVIRAWPYANPRVPVNVALTAAANEIRRIAKIVDANDPESDVARYNANSYREPVKVSQELITILMACQKMYEASERRFDVTFVPYKLKDLTPDDYNAITRWERKTPDPTQTSIHLFGNENVLLDVKTMELRRYNRRLRLNLKGMIRGYMANKAMDVLVKQGLYGAAVFVDGLSAVHGVAMKDPQLTCIENPAVLGTCLYKVTPKDTSKPFYIGSSASIERRGEMFDPGDAIWSYRSGGVNIAGHSGEWVQFAATITGIMEDGDVMHLLDNLKKQRIAGAYFDKSTSQEFRGSLEPVAHLEKLVK